MKTQTDGLPIGAGLGTFAFSGVFSPVSQHTAQQIVEEFLSSGGAYVETAPVYPVREVDLGAILQGIDRRSFFLATKCVTGANADGAKIRSGAPDFIRWQVEQELARLGVDYLDLVQAHAVPDDVEIEVVGTALQDLQSRGIARHIGVSNIDLGQLTRVADVADISLVQNRFSLIHQTSYRDVEQYCSAQKIGLNPYQVIERGQLTDHPTDWTNSRSEDLRNSKHEYAGEPHHVIRAWAKQHLDPVAEDAGVSVEVLVTAWALAQPAIRVCVIGATTKEQVRSLHARVRPGLLSKDTLARVDQAYGILARNIEARYRLTVEEYRGVA